MLESELAQEFFFGKITFLWPPQPLQKNYKCGKWNKKLKKMRRRIKPLVGAVKLLVGAQWSMEEKSGIREPRRKSHGNKKSGGRGDLGKQGFDSVI